MDESQRRVSFLASVTNESEARLCASLGADIIDAKDPSQGALGALPGDRVRAIRAAVPGEVPVSATVGDSAPGPDSLAHAVRFMASSGVDIVKVGFRVGAGEERAVRRLGKLALGGVRLVGVLLVDRGLDLHLIGPMREAGFLGVMLDTDDKALGALPERLPESALREFIDRARDAGLLAGLAGSLRREHVPRFLALGPDVLGFRGGICHEGTRVAGIDADAVRAVRAAIPKRPPSSAELDDTPLPDAMALRQSETTA